MFPEGSADEVKGSDELKARERNKMWIFLKVKFFLN
jgi:hypothetical protein